MNEELKFQKLSEVELLEEAPEDAHPLVETGGTIKRVKGGLGGGGYATLRLSTPIVEFEQEVELELNEEDQAQVTQALEKGLPVWIIIPFDDGISYLSGIGTPFSMADISSPFVGFGFSWGMGIGFITPGVAVVFTLGL